jgi:hypothetical protein
MPPASAIPSASQPSGLVTEQVGRLSVTHPVAGTCSSARPWSSAATQGRRCDEPAVSAAGA